MRKGFTYVIILLVTVLTSNGQEAFRFAHVSDTHVGSATGLEDLRRTVADINTQPDIRFVIISGDITEFGSDSELWQAKQVLDTLNKKWYIIPGNHDDTWSESGTNSFLRIFGQETFSFSYGGYCFLGTNCGPNLRMGPGQVPHENLLWLDSSLHHLSDNRQPVIYVNHYPIDSGLNNWYKIIDLLKQYNTQVILCGHGHSNHVYDFEGIPGIMGRSNLRAKDSAGAYNIVTINKGSIVYQERYPGETIQTAWAALDLHSPINDTLKYPRPSYAVNERYPGVKVLWEYQDKADIGCGIVLFHDLLLTANAKGELFALKKAYGKPVWRFLTGGKIFSTPAVEGERVVVASTDGNIYCLQAANGRLLWKYKTGSPIVASPLLRDGKIYIGSSDGYFRALRLTDGKLQWDFKEVKGFVESQPLFYEGKIYFASWANEVYVLNAARGQLAWKWNSGASNRMFSAASCRPVIANGKLFIVAPDRYMTALDARSGTLTWRKHWDSAWVRESMGLSADSSLVYAKTMQGKIIGVSTVASEPVISWTSDLDLGYELDPAPIREQNGIVCIPSDKGLAAGIDRATGKVCWLHKIAHSLLNTVEYDPQDTRRLFITSADGKIACLSVISAN